MHELGYYRTPLKACVEMAKARSAFRIKPITSYVGAYAANKHFQETSYEEVSFLEKASVGPSLSSYIEIHNFPVTHRDIEKGK